MTSEPRSSTNEGEGHDRDDDSDCSSDNYGTLSDDEYVSREDVEGKSSNERQSEADSRGSTLSASTNDRADNPYEVATAIDENRADDTFSFGSSSFDDFSNRNSELIESCYGNDESNNEIKSLSVGGSAGIPNVGRPFGPQFCDLSSSFFSSTSSATSSNLSLNLFNPSSKESSYNPSAGISRDKKEHVYESLPDIYRVSPEIWAFRFQSNGCSFTSIIKLNSFYQKLSFYCNYKSITDELLNYLL